MPEKEWTIIAGPTEVSPGDLDSTLFRFEVERDEERRTVTVAISNTLMASEATTLTSPIDYIVSTRGEAAVRDAIARDRIPKRITVNSSGMWDHYGDGDS